MQLRVLCKIHNADPWIFFIFVPKKFGLDQETVRKTDSDHILLTYICWYNQTGGIANNDATVVTYSYTPYPVY